MIEIEIDLCFLYLVIFYVYICIRYLSSKSITSDHLTIQITLFQKRKPDVGYKNL